MKFLLSLIAFSMLTILLLSACASPCWTPNELEYRTDCNIIGRVIDGV